MTRKPDGPDNFLLHPMYVSSSDNLHNSNKHINITPKKYVLANLKYSNEHKRLKRPNNRQICADTIRDPFKRSNSFNSLTMTNRKGSLRPKSLCSDAYFDT
ncbi:hypothetical protein NQ314_001421 [Rhamnusium bicolor]|uniref:Uncharacterized protein n=1 Tax=Rhamnusium bicolor TaxID=1586634 RepID=A0AAV8ZRR0_9CUCU|nr:hypothetical protein NQ314_001421 [Rhamnusium bicolor]